MHEIIKYFLKMLGRTAEAEQMSSMQKEAWRYADVSTLETLCPQLFVEDDTDVA